MTSSLEDDIALNLQVMHSTESNATVEGLVDHAVFHIGISGVPGQEEMNWVSVLFVGLANITELCIRDSGGRCQSTLRVNHQNRTLLRLFKLALIALYFDIPVQNRYSRPRLQL